MLHLFPLTHRDASLIGIIFAYDSTIAATLKNHPSIQYSKTHSCYYIPYDKVQYSALQSLGFAITSHTSRPDIYQPPIKDGDRSVKTLGDNVASNKTNNTDQKVQPHQIDQPGTAYSPSESDIASIATPPVVPTVHPSYGDSKGTDIHLVKGGRSIQLSGTNFYISIYYNEEDIKFLKGLKGYWQSKIKKWIVKATTINLEAIQQNYAFWDEQTYQKIRELILNVRCPYLVTLYRTPDAIDVVMVQITGHKSNTSIVKNITCRAYQKDEMRWTIPNDQIILKRLKEDYIRDGATVIDRLPQEGFDYHKKKESYGQFKARYLLKIEKDLVPIVERYIDTLTAYKRSHRTMTT
ncbi:MAG: hypothetical protein WBO36_13640, partial [Saprospiraceae bacterium]